MCNDHIPKTEHQENGKHPFVSRYPAVYVVSNITWFSPKSFICRKSEIIHMPKISFKRIRISKTSFQTSKRWTKWENINRYSFQLFRLLHMNIAVSHFSREHNGDAAFSQGTVNINKRQNEDYIWIFTFLSLPLSIHHQASTIIFLKKYSEKDICGLRNPCVLLPHV